VNVIKRKLIMMMVQADGQLKSWGRGSSGQLGYGSITDSANPVRI